MKFNKSLLLPVVLTLFVLVGVLIYVDKNSSMSPFDHTGAVVITPDPSLNSKIMDTDGTFVDYQNGYKFEYPKDVFKSQPVNFFDKGLSKVFYIPTESSTGVPGLPKVELTYVVNTSTVSAQATQKNDYQSKPKSEWPLTTSVIVKNINNSGLKGLITYSYPTGGGEGEPSWGYAATWQADKSTVSLNLSSSSEQELNNYKDMFFKVVDGFTKVASK